MQKHAETQRQHESFVSSTPVSGDMRPVMSGLIPAFRDTSTGEIHLSLDQNGEISTEHSFFHLPKHWVSHSTSSGEAMILMPTIEAGYWRPHHFIAITKHLRLPLDS
ncbi:MAG: hypothetical protein KTR35_15860 [Gammaproteobacteria bacterium]|nr:hypothetical protein [Gammaproteobacteria bacterium]